MYWSEVVTRAQNLCTNTTSSAKKRTKKCLFVFSFTNTDQMLQFFWLSLTNAIIYFSVRHVDQKYFDLPAQVKSVSLANIVPAALETDIETFKAELRYLWLCLVILFLLWWCVGNLRALTLVWGFPAVTRGAFGVLALSNPNPNRWVDSVSANYAPHMALGALKPV